ncbi:MAG: hypothetical protein A2275_02470 [Bacteroidetes bacterium RIFOXYA12_FULL_35_11]|nr:MAG: hypothetical protein A2X01_01525 [Bacteroidetes bacterium GWF2_35_48]OFY74088.1 MAG: hypothetical protein A2275_02470 [Bacteroidetes bacterium RIFOXYA12_FULL_35_11]OFY95339.1 MAG: hypothetical protein A2309_11340 [Bacteroidetes bacterium RIFOXYB2_FULL_35_7]OFZ03294.1 MAG: hypothetical protein A2491_18435 [Bacteroidetes bacterium RIFOXYC12_FULL_35_7]HBX51891.1 hypothetical protein [Bacteroidales bacterium]
MNLKDLGKKIRVMRAEKSLSQENVAVELGISTTAYSKIERGETNVSFTRLIQIADFFGMGLIEFLEKQEARPYKNKKAKQDSQITANEDTSGYNKKQDNNLKKEMVQLRELLKAKEEIIELLKKKK